MADQARLNSVKMNEEKFTPVTDLILHLKYMSHLAYLGFPPGTDLLLCYDIIDMNVVVLIKSFKC